MRRDFECSAGSVVINMSRGALVNEDDLYENCAETYIRAGDVFAHAVGR